MNAIYRVLQISKQSFHKRMDRYIAKQQEKEQLKVVIRKIREDHPMMGSRDLYRFIRPEKMGRDQFEQFYFEEGFRVKRPKKYQRTTNSLGVTRFDNLIEGLEVTRVNQVWVSDITYYDLGERFYFLTFIMDLFTRRIVGFSSSRKLRTEDTTIPALKMAIMQRNGVNLKGLILHSDGGGQYYCKEFREITEDEEMLNSMCKSVYENPHAERLNGIIKNNYVIHYKPQTYKELGEATKKAVNMYNSQKPHSSLNGLSPIKFEQIILKKNCNIESENNSSSYYPHSTLTTTVKIIRKMNFI